MPNERGWERDVGVFIYTVTARELYIDKHKSKLIISNCVFNWLKTEGLPKEIYIWAPQNIFGQRKIYFDNEKI